MSDRSASDNNQVAYDAAGNAKGYYVVSTNNRQTQYTTDYKLFDSYKDGRVAEQNDRYVAHVHRVRRR